MTGPQTNSPTGRLVRPLVRPVILGALAGALFITALVTLLPGKLAHSLIPWSAGSMLGLLVFLRLGANNRSSWMVHYRYTAIAVCLAMAIVEIFLVIDPRALQRSHFPVWIPFIAGSAALLWAGRFALRRKNKPYQLLNTALLAGLALSAVVLHNGVRMYDTLRGDYLRAWNLVHYYVGSKYFAEVGYQDLYKAVVVADDQWRAAQGTTEPDQPGTGEKRTTGSGEATAGVDEKREGFGFLRRLRDMKTYRTASREQLVAGYRPLAFRNDRWRQFGRDIRLLHGQLKPKTWQKVFIDLGYNSPPSWTLLGTPLANLIPLDSWANWLIANSDLPLFILMFFFLWRGFGLDVALVATIWMNTIEFNHHRFSGGFFQYDWLASAVIGFTLFCRGKPRAGGVVFSWAVMTRVFPAFCVLPLVVKMVVDLIRQKPWKTPSPHRSPLTRWIDCLNRPQLAFVVSLGIASTAIFGLSHLTGRGLTSWPEWIEKMEVHSRYHPVTSQKRIGAGRLAQHKPTADDFWQIRRGSKDDRLKAGRVHKRILQLVGALLLVLALIKRFGKEAMALMLYFSFLMVTTSRYYASIWILLLTLGSPRANGAASWPSTLAGVVLLLLAACFFISSDLVTRYLVANYGVMILFSGLCLSYIIGDLRARRREVRS